MVFHHYVFTYRHEPLNFNTNGHYSVRIYSRKQRSHCIINLSAVSRAAFKQQNVPLHILVIKTRVNNTEESIKLTYTTVVWEKLMVGNIHEKKSVAKNFHLSRLQTIINCSISLWLENFCVFNFRCTWRPTKIFSCQIFRKLRYIKNDSIKVFRFHC